MNLNSLSKEELINLVKEKKIGQKELTDNGICPTCFDKENNGILYGNKEMRMIYEDDDIECFFDGHPKGLGHTIISSKKHYKDMMELPDDLCEKIFLFTKKLMNILKKVYQSESVYLCTMCDGPMNHFHLQLILRYSSEKRGSNNFIKERITYIHDEEKRQLIKKLLCEK